MLRWVIFVTKVVIQLAIFVQLTVSIPRMFEAHEESYYFVGAVFLIMSGFSLYGRELIPVKIQPSTQYISLVIGIILISVGFVLRFDVFN